MSGRVGTQLAPAPLGRLLGGIAACCLALFAAALTTLRCAASAAGPSDAVRAELRGYVENVTQATARRYAARDSAGRKMDTAKIIRTASAQAAFDRAVLQWGVGGNVGDRDALWFKGFQFGIVEGQLSKGDFGSWRSFLHDFQTGGAEMLSIHTDGGSTAFANPTLTHLVAPDGQSAVVVTAFVPSEGAANGEAGELIYYRTYSLVVRYEAEELILAASSGDLPRTVLDAGYSAGRGTILEANAVGDSVTCSVRVPQARRYDVRVRVKKLNNRGIWQFDSNGVSHGAPADGFSSSSAFVEADVGPVTFSTAGVKAFRFRVTGRNPASSGFWIALDSIQLIPL